MDSTSVKTEEDMKKTMKFWLSAILILTIQWQTTYAQQIDEDRMKRDIQVAENVLATLIKHEINQQRTFFGMDIKGSYQPGYGVTFRLPGDYSMPYVISIGGDDIRGAAVVSEGNTYRYSFRTNGVPENEAVDEAYKLNEKTSKRKQLTTDSIRAVYNDRVIQAAKDFILDYGDFISQLAPDEKIVVTNQSDRPQFYFNSGKRTRISVEGTRADITALKQGKLTRDQALKKLAVVNTESVEAREPDMEMLSTIFTRLYRPDLSKTYFTQSNVYYERLKNYGAIYYMQMVSSEERGLNRFYMPTLALDNLDQEARDRKVTELYPEFERDIKDNMLEYGRTLKSLNDDEVLVLNISMTRCTGCGIPGTLEVSIKSSVLKAFGAGRMDKPTAMGKFMLKKGGDQ